MNKAEIYFNGQCIKTIQCDCIHSADPIIGLTQHQLSTGGKVVALIPQDYAIILILAKEEQQDEAKV